MRRRLGGDAGGDAGPCEGSECDELQSWKVSLIFVLAVVTFLSSTAPWVARRCFKRGALDVINGCSALAAGIVFGAFLSHMVPDSMNAFTRYLEAAYAEDPENPMIEYPFSQMIIGAVVILLIALDRLVVTHGVHGDGDSHSHDHISQAFTAMQASEAEKKADAAGAASAESKLLLPMRSASDLPLTGGDAIAAAHASETTLVVAESVGRPPRSDYGTVAAAALHTAEAHGHSHGTMSDPKAVASTMHKDAIMRALVFTTAISIHSIMDGLSIGAESSPGSFYSIVAAVVAHKVFDGVALGVPIFLAQMSKAATIGALVFTALMTPLGIAIGLGATAAAEASARELAEAIIVSISAGSFLFISIVELLPAALADGRWARTKMATFALGWFVMVLLAAWL